jgi:hypothetical protein
MKSGTIQIFEKTWTIQIHSPEDYIKLYGERSDGTTICKGRLINLQTTELGWDTIYHELMHAAFYETGIHQDQEKTLNGLEEVLIQFTANHIFTLLFKVLEIYSIAGVPPQEGLKKQITKVEHTLTHIQEKYEGHIRI